MAFVNLKSCVAEGDLAEAILDVRQNLGDIKKELDQLLAGINADSSVLLEGNDILDCETAQAPNPLGDFTEEAGLPAINPSELTDEQRLELLGIILIRGVLYLAGSDQNIENFRRLYFALGADIDLFLEVLGTEDPFVVTQTYLRTQKLPQRPTEWSVEEAQELLQNPAVESVYRAGDGETYCVVPQFLAINKSAQQVSQQNNLKLNQISTQLFWLRSVTINSSIINRLNSYGIRGEQQTSVLAGERLISVRPSVLSGFEISFSEQTQKALRQIELLDNRWGKIDQAAKESFRKDILASTQDANKSAYSIQNTVRFWPTLIDQPDQIGVFLSKNKPADLEYLFSTRRTVRSIDFSVQDEEVIRVVRQALSVPAGSTTLSALQSNRSIVGLDPSIDLANLRLIQNTCAVDSSSKTPLTYPALQMAYGCLTQSLENPQTLEERTIPLSGYESYDSPASILFRRADLFLSLGLDKKLRELEDSVSEEAQPIREVVQSVALLLRESKVLIDNLFKEVRQKMNQYTAEAESFMSRYMALQGTAAVDASILRCAFGYDLSADLPILQELRNYIEDAERVIRAQLSRFAAFLSNTLNKLLCYPVNLANGFLGGLENNLPNFCQAYKVKLPVDIEALMVEIRDQYTFQGDLTRAYQRDLFRVQATFQGSPGRLDLFRESLVCESNANSRFFRQSQQIIGGKVSIPSPISGLPGIGR